MKGERAAASFIKADHSPNISADENSGEGNG
jgi:hypothetical protein